MRRRANNCVIYYNEMKSFDKASLSSSLEVRRNIPFEAISIGLAEGMQNISPLPVMQQCMFISGAIL